MVLSLLDACTVVDVILIWSLKLGTVTKYIVAFGTILDHVPIIYQLVVPIY